MRNEDVKLSRRIVDPVDWQEEREVLARMVVGGDFNDSNSAPKAFTHLSDALFLVGSEISRGANALERIAEQLEASARPEFVAAADGVGYQEPLSPEAREFLNGYLAQHAKIEPSDADDD